MSAVAYCCENSAVKAAASLGPSAEATGVELIPVPCAGRVEVEQLLKPIEEGVEQVAVVACPLDICTYIHGNRRLLTRVEVARSALRQAGLDPERISVHMVSSVDTYKMLEVLKRLSGGQQPGKAGGHGKRSD
jgi:coenzyme F420-reducing hydrogenase delta subunit